MHLHLHMCLAMKEETRYRHLHLHTWLAMKDETRYRHLHRLEPAQGLSSPVTYIMGKISIKNAIGLTTFIAERV